jgi:hypothetical protein
MSPLQERAFIHLEFVWVGSTSRQVGSFLWINRDDCFRYASCARNGRENDRDPADARRVFAILAKLEKGNLRCLPTGTALYARAGSQMAPEAPGRVFIDSAFTEVVVLPKVLENEEASTTLADSWRQGIPICGTTPRSRTLFSFTDLIWERCAHMSGLCVRPLSSWP